MAPSSQVWESTQLSNFYDLADLVLGEKIRTPSSASQHKGGFVIIYFTQMMLLRLQCRIGAPKNKVDATNQRR